MEFEKFTLQFIFFLLLLLFEVMTFVIQTVLLQKGIGTCRKNGMVSGMARTIQINAFFNAEKQLCRGEL